MPSSDGPKAASPPGIRRATAATSAVVGKSRGSKEVAKLIGIKRQLIWKQNKELVVQSRWIAVCFITIAITGSYFNYKTSLNPITAYAAFSVLAVIGVTVFYIAIMEEKKLGELQTFLRRDSIGY